MGTKKKIIRNRNKTILKKRINELLKLLELSRSAWKRIGLRVTGCGLDALPAEKYFSANDPKVKWGRHKKGHKPSLKTQFSVLWDLWQDRIKNQKFLDELKEQLEQIKEKEEK